MNEVKYTKPSSKSYEENLKINPLVPNVWQ